jgi:hypothetical protein
MTDEVDNSLPRSIADARQASVEVSGAPPQDIPSLVSDLYAEAPEPVRAKLLEHLLQPVGPLAMVAIAAGAFRRFVYRLRSNAMPIPVEDTANVTSGHVLQLARYVEQSSPSALRQVVSSISNRPLRLARNMSMALKHRLADISERY